MARVFSRLRKLKNEVVWKKVPWVRGGMGKGGERKGLRKLADATEGWSERI